MNAMLLDDTEETRAGDDSLGAPRRAATLTRGDTVGRYVVLSELGAGGMGVVYAAYDPELDRKVALKVLRPGVAEASSDGSARLLREAQALAKLSHPNVVAIHDVGTHGDDVWLAMEYVAGRTFGAWLQERPRSWGDVLATIRPVAIGLAAAHEAGLVHRDIKPDNVMIGDDGRVRVMDFGLARGTAADTDTGSGASSSMLGRSLQAKLTQAGATPGTPAYMAPEQMAGTPTDGRTDQFSLCVTLWEALYGQRPFAGDSVISLASNVLEGKRRAPPSGRNVPRWLRRILDRGLATEPDARWASMPDFLAALDRGRRRARAGRVFAGLGVVAAMVGGGLGVQYLDEQRAVTACQSQGDAIDEVWNDDVRAEVARRLRAAGGDFAATTADKVTPWLDDQADAWRDARTEACLDTRVRHAWDTDTFDRAEWCLDDRKLQLESLVEQLQTADAEIVRGAVPAVAMMRPVAPCRDATLLGRLPAPPDESQREEIRRVKQALSQAEATDALGQPDHGLERARDALTRAEEVGWPPLVAAARHRYGNSLRLAGNPTKAEPVLESAYFESIEAGATLEALTTALDLTRLVGWHLGRADDGERWWKHAEVLRASLPDSAGLHEAWALVNLGNVRQRATAYGEAAKLYERALVILERTYGPDHLRVAFVVEMLAIARELSGDLERARPLYERVLRLRTASIGARHPDVARALTNLGVLEARQGHHDAARARFEEALDILEDALGPEHPDVVLALMNLALSRSEVGRLEEAEADLERAVEISERRLGPTHPDLAKALSSLAGVRARMGAPEQAIAPLHRAVRIFEDTGRTTHPLFAEVLYNLGAAELDAGHPAEAVPVLERVLAIQRDSLGLEHVAVASTLGLLGEARLRLGSYPQAAQHFEDALRIREGAPGPDGDVAFPLLGLAEVAMADGRAADAVSFAERAVQVREDSPGAPIDAAKARWVLARALSQVGGSEPRALVVARQALENFKQAGDLYGDEIAEVDAWLREHGDAP